MKQIYLLILLATVFINGTSLIKSGHAVRITSTSETTHCITIRGNRTNGKFQQLLLDSKGSYQSDTSQPEIVAAAWTCASGGYYTCNFRGLFRYDVSSVPANAVVTSAKLYLYAKTNAINGNYGNPMYGSANTALLQKVTANWTVANTGWLNQPAATATNQKTLPQSTSATQNYVVDVTDFVQSWVNQPATNYGMLLRLQNESYYNSMIFNSGQATDSTLQPRLEICYQIPTPTCSNSLVIKGDPFNGKFQQALMGTWHPTASDTTQPEIVAAAWTCASGGYSTCNFRSMLRYDVSSVPANAVVSSAKLYLYAKTNNINGNPGNPTFGTDNTALLQKAISAWNNATVAWNNQPAVTSTSQKTLPQSTSTAQDYTVDVTDFVQSWVNKPDSNFGMMLRLQNESYYNSMVFNSGQATDSTRQPRLEICYTVPATGTDSCRGNFTDSIIDNNPLKKGFVATTWNSANKKPAQICWSFGDGKDTCLTYSPANGYYGVTHTYATPGSYNVCVTIKYDGGCVASRCRTITVFGAPATPGCTDGKNLIVRGDRTSGHFRQLFLDSNAPFAADTSQPELGAAAWTCYTGGYPTCNFRSLFRYELSSIPTNTRVTSAKLHLYAKTNNINGQPGSPTYGSNNTALLQQVTEPWKTGGTGWNNQPATTTERQKQLAQSLFTAQNYVVDVTDFVQTWVKHPEQNHGMLLRLQAEQYYNSLIFHSGQAPDSLKPRLEICYQLEEADSNKIEVKLYPNPTTGPLLAWVYTSDAQKGSASLYDLRGNLKQVLNSSISYYAGVNVITFNINRVSVPAGYYYVKIWVGSTYQTFKVLIL